MIEVWLGGTITRIEENQHDMMCAIEQLLDELTMKILLWQVLFTQYNYKNLFDMYELGRATVMVDEISKNSGKKL